MKKIFRTSVFWIAVVILFWAYVKLFDSNLGGKMAGWFYTAPVIIQGGVTESPEDTSTINDQLTKINDRLLNILEVLSQQKNGQPQAQVSVPIVPTTPGVMTGAGLPGQF